MVKHISTFIWKGLRLRKWSEHFCFFPKKKKKLKIFCKDCCWLGPSWIKAGHKITGCQTEDRRGTMTTQDGHSTSFNAPALLLKQMGLCLYLKQTKKQLI